MKLLFNNTVVLLMILVANFIGLHNAHASSHREAPLIADDPLADNTDVYAFRSPDMPDMVTIIANYIPLQLPQGGPNYYTFGENIRYEINIQNDPLDPNQRITYRFTFNKVDEDPTTFFNIRLGQQNQKTTYNLEKTTDGGLNWTTIVTNGVVPPPNIGKRSIEDPVVGLGSDYSTLVNSAITSAITGEMVFAGPADDPFFVDLGGIFDLGDAPRQKGTPRDGVACMNVHSIALQVPISMLQKDGKTVDLATNILDGDFTIGVWASASRRQIRTLSSTSDPVETGDWVQVSRLGMPLTNEVIVPLGDKDDYNSRPPFLVSPDELNGYYNPELALYMDDALFGGAVPAFQNLRVQRNSLGSFDFGNGNDGLFGLKGTPAVAGTALELLEDFLLPGAGLPRSVDILPIFTTGVPNQRPYQLATGKGGDPLAAGKPFINNFLPFGDMLRLNMAVPPTDRNSPEFSPLGLIDAAVRGLTDPIYNNTSIEMIPNMDGFPNGRRLEDDVTRIELQAVSGVVLAAIGLWYDDFDPTDPTSNPVSPALTEVLAFTTGVESNDASFKGSFPYLGEPWAGDGRCGGRKADALANCGAPDNLQAENTTLTSAELSWSDEGVNRYKITYVKLVGGSVAGPIQSMWSPFNRVTLEGLDSCSTYGFRVQTKCPTTGIFTSADGMFTTGCMRQIEEQEDMDLDLEVLVFPNPATDNVSVAFTMAEAYEVTARLVSINGAVIDEITAEAQSGRQTISFDLRSLDPGVYFIQLINDEGQVVRKFVHTR